MPTLKKPEKQKNRSINDEERKKIYATTKWRKLRLAKLMEQPLCEMCLKEGKTKLGEDVHHIISFLSTNDPNKRKQLAFDYNNLMTICKYHHQLIHNGEKNN